MHPTADGGLEIEQIVGDGEVCCQGTLAYIGETLPAAPAADLGTVEGLGRTTASTALGGATTQYAAAAEGSVWFPLEDRGQVARVDAASGEIQALIEIGDPSAIPDLMSDPHAVAAGDAGIWVTNAAERSVGRIDPATNTVAESIPLQVVPYALALDGGTLWVTSFLDDRVVRVDLESGEVVADISVPKPTGIAIGFDGVWVVNHRDDTIARIDPDTNKVVEEIGLGERGPNDLCGMCVENVVVGDDAVWTANNEGRSVSRIDPKSNKVTATIDLPLRAWAVSAGGGSIWAGQFEDGAERWLRGPVLVGRGAHRPGDQRGDVLPGPGDERQLGSGRALDRGTRPPGRFGRPARGRPLSPVGHIAERAPGRVIPPRRTSNLRAPRRGRSAGSSCTVARICLNHSGSSIR